MQKVSTIPKKRLALIDGSGFIFRAFHALPSLVRSDGVEVNAVFGFTRMFINLVDSLKVDYIAVIFDAARKTFRNEIYTEYKSHRPEAPPDLIPQFALIREATKACNIIAIEKNGFEADDLIATYTKVAQQQNIEVIIASSDKDLMQLVSDENSICMFDSVKKKFIKEIDVIEKFGLPPSKLIYAQALIGDASDNVPGIKGLGVKTAASLIKEFNDLEGIYNNINNVSKPAVKEKLIQGKDLAFLSLSLVTLKNDIPIDVDISELYVNKINYTSLYDFLIKQEFKSLASAIAKKHNIAEKPISLFANQAVSQTVNQNSLSLENNTLLNHVHNHFLNQHQTENTSENPQNADATNPTSFVDSVNTTAATNNQESWWFNENKLKPDYKHQVKLPEFQNYTIKIVNNIQNLQAILQDLTMAINLSISYVKADGNKAIVINHENTIYVIEFIDDSTLKDNDLFNQDPKNTTSLTVADIVTNMVTIFRDESINKVVFDAKELLTFLSELNITQVSSVNDISIIAYLLDGVNNSKTNLEALDFMLQKNGLQELRAGVETITNTLSPQLQIYKTAISEAINLQQLYFLFKQRLVFEKLLDVYESIDKPLIQVLHQMEQEGVLVNLAILKDLGVIIDADIKKLEHTISLVAGSEINLASPKQIGDLLFIKLNIKGKKNKTGSWKTDVNALEELEAQGVEIAGQIIEWRKLNKLKNTYIEVLPKHINKSTQRIHTTFVQNKVNTGRLASFNPNLQNIPIKNELGRKIRSAFVAKSGYKLISLDYSQIELRILADIANIPTLINSFKHDEDIHTTTAQEIFNLTKQEVTPEFRRKAKTINFGIIYGISEFGLAKRLQLNKDEAKRYINTYFQRYPEILTYMEQAKNEAKTSGYVLTKQGRKCYIDGINHKNHAIRSFAERAAINAKLQGTAADIIRLAMVKVARYLANNQKDAKLILQVHDELVIEVKEDIALTVAADIKKIMEEIYNLKVQLTVNYAIDNNWLLAH